MKKIFKYICFSLLLTSCDNYLDIVPDNVATIESAFTLRSTAERYLFTCYSWMPQVMNMASDPAAGYWGGEIWGKDPIITNNAYRYGQNDNGISSPRLNYWSGSNGGTAMFRAIRDCNIFLENVHKVPDIDSYERNRWIAEAKFLKAYYHFILMRMYGPIPLIKESLPISASPEEVQQPRNNMDDCFAYVIQLIDEANQDLPVSITDVGSEMGRITQVVAKSLKAKVLITSASPLYNGNGDYVSFLNHDKTPLMNTSYSLEKWKLALDACKEAIDIAHENGVFLHKFVQESGIGTPLSETTIYKLSIANALTSRWNSETIWADPNYAVPQGEMTPSTWDPAFQPGSFNHISGNYGPSIEFTERFYTKNGVPMEEDKTFDYNNKDQIVTTRSQDAVNFQSNYQVVKMHLDREYRFYANLAFDGIKWYGHGKYTETDNWIANFKRGGNLTMLTQANSITGYQVNKRIHYQNVINGTSSYSTIWYPAMILRLADLYLLYAEALNEYQGPNEEVYTYLNLVRERAGIPSVQSAWTNFSTDPNKYQHKDGLREIIHRERELELCFESQLFWDAKRWKKAEQMFTTSISGWNYTGATATDYYKRGVVFNQKFEKRNYFDPIAENILLYNTKLVQNPGW